MKEKLTSRLAAVSDAALLGEMNKRLIEDEGHRNAMTVQELQERMSDWLKDAYKAVIFESDNGVVGYALYREEAESIYLRQLFIERGRRRQGLGQEAFRILRGEFWASTKRLTVDVLVANSAAVSFWKKVGFQEYCLNLEILPEAK